MHCKYQTSALQIHCVYIRVYIQPCIYHTINSLFVMHSLDTVVEIGFSQDTYTAFEGEQVHVCVEYFSSFYIGAPIVFRVESFGQSFGDSVAMKGFGDAEGKNSCPMLSYRYHF